MEDRAVDYPRRYRLVPVSDATDVFDLEPVPGGVTNAGTPLNKDTFLTDATFNAAKALNGGQDMPSLPDRVLSLFCRLFNQMQATLNSLSGQLASKQVHMALKGDNTSTKTAHTVVFTPEYMPPGVALSTDGTQVPIPSNVTWLLFRISTVGARTAFGSMSCTIKAANGTALRVFGTSELEHNTEHYSMSVVTVALNVSAYRGSSVSIELTGRDQSSDDRAAISCTYLEVEALQ